MITEYYSIVAALKPGILVTFVQPPRPGILKQMREEVITEGWRQREPTNRLRWLENRNTKGPPGSEKTRFDILIIRK